MVLEDRVGELEAIPCGEKQKPKVNSPSFFSTFQSLERIREANTKMYTELTT